MKKLLAVIVIVLAGCATQQPPPKYQLDKQANRAAIESGRKVEVFYHADDFTVVDLGGSQSANVLGILGPIGTLIGLATHAAHKLDAPARAQRRSEEFSKQIADNMPDQSMNRDFARKLGDLLEKDGREVKLTQVKRPSGNADLALSKSEDMIATEGYMQLMLRLTVGYGATSATDSFKPVTIIEYALKDPAGKALMSRSFTRIYGEADKTYLSYPGLLEDYKGAREELAGRLNYWNEPLYTEIFRFSDADSAAVK